MGNSQDSSNGRGAGRCTPGALTFHDLDSSSVSRATAGAGQFAGSAADVLLPSQAGRPCK